MVTIQLAEAQVAAINVNLELVMGLDKIEDKRLADVTIAYIDLCKAIAESVVPNGTQIIVGE